MALLFPRLIKNIKKENKEVNERLCSIQIKEKTDIFHMAIVNEFLIICEYLCLISYDLSYVICTSFL